MAGSAAVALLEDARYRHHAAAGHPERPDRLVAIGSAIAASADLTELPRVAAAEADDDTLALAHTRTHIERVGALAKSGGGWFDADTYCTATSDQIARLAVGGAVVTANAVLDGVSAHSFALVRPPGHHATAERAMGFCLYNNAAIVIRHAQRRGAQRIAVLDIDVHHGNGTEAIIWDDKNVLYTSLHQSPFYPGTGDAADRGAHDNVLNVPLPAGTSAKEWLSQLDTLVLPALTAHGPDLIVVSAGYDGHQADPLAQFELSTATYAAVAERVAALTTGSVWLLEGGYDLDALSDSVMASIHGLMGITQPVPGTV